MASLRPSLGASRVGSCIGRGGKAVSRVVVALPPTPLGRQTTNAVVVASSPSSASSSQQPYVPSETRPTRPEHAGRQLDSSGSASTRVRRRSRRRRQGDANASAASASASAPSFEQTSSSALEGGSGVDSEPFGSSGAELSAPEERRPAAPTADEDDDAPRARKEQQQQQRRSGNGGAARAYGSAEKNPPSSPSPSPSPSSSFSSSNNNAASSTRFRQRGGGEPIPMDKFARGELVVGKVTSVSPAGARVALLGHKPRVVAFCPAKEMGPPRCVVVSAASQAAATAALALKAEKKKRDERKKAAVSAAAEASEAEVTEEAAAATEEAPSSSASSSSPEGEDEEETREEAAARKLIKAAKLAASAQPVPAEHMQVGDVRQFVIMYTPKVATYGGVGPAVSARRADEQVMWRRAEAIAAVCRDDAPPKSSSNSASSSSSSNSSSSFSNSSNSASSRGGDDDDSLAWDEEEAPKGAAAEAEAETTTATTAAESAAETTGEAAATEGGEEAEAKAQPEAAAAAEEEVAIDEAYLGPDAVLVTITGCNDGGLLTSLAGLPAFIPFSQVDAASLGLAQPEAAAAAGNGGRDPQRRGSGKDSSSSSSQRAWLTAATAAPAVGKKVRAVPTEVDAAAERIVLSVRAASELSARQQLKVGALIWGTVRKAASYGLFVGIDDTRESALLHATNVSRGARLPESPLEVLPLGSRVRALVVGMDEGGRRLSLSTAEIEENDGDMLVDPEKVYAGAEEQALYFRRHLEALAAQEAARGGGGYGNQNYNNNNGNYNKKGNNNNNNNNRKYYDDDGGDDGGREWSSG